MFGALKTTGGNIFAAFAVAFALVSTVVFADRGHDRHGQRNHPPRAASATLATNEDTPSAVVIPVVIDRDKKDRFTFAIVSQPAHGSAAVVGDGLVYTPNPNFNGADSFTFRATDRKGRSVIGTASVTVNPVNDAPTVASVSITTDEDTQSAPVSPAVTDADSGDNYIVSIDSQPAHGSASVAGNRLIYVPAQNYNGPDSFTLRVTDAGGLSAAAMATVIVNPVNDAPTFASAGILTDEDTASAPVAPNVVDADTGDTFTFTVLSQPGNGSAQIMDNRLVYTPAPNFNGADSFTFSASDAVQSVIGTANVTVIPVNDAPTATGASRSLFRGLAGGGARTPWVDDVDIFDTATFQITSTPLNGAAAVVGNALTYVPNAGTNATTDAFTYRATDSGGATVDGAMRLRLFGNANLTTCTQTSTVNNATGALIDRTRSHPCAFYQRSDTREGSTAIPVTIDYIRNWPSNTSAPRGVVVLIAGGDLGGSDPETFIAGNDATGQATASPGNFVIRTAQLFADAGFLAVALERPSDEPAGNASVDQYRISVKHAVDIVGLLKHANPTNLPVFLVGTSRGAMSAVANNVIATGIALPSPVTNNGGNAALLYVGRPDIPSLLPSAVKRPAHVLWHDGDLCTVSPPAGSQTLFNDLGGAGVAVTSDTTTGGIRVTNPPADVDVCGALDFHGFLGIEPTAVGLITTWLNARVNALGANKLPEAAYVTVPTAAGAAKQIDLATLTRDADGDTLAYALSHTSTVLGGTVTSNGTTVTYTPPAGVTNRTDHFVYVVTDGNGGVAAAVISIQIGS